MYSAKIINQQPTQPGCWNYTTIGIFKDDIQIGEYLRNYPNFYNTFFPFQHKNNWYALYSHKYTSTSVMSLPDCKEIITEPNHPNGFCPTDFYVPKYYEYLVKGVPQEELKNYPEQNRSWISKDKIEKIYLNNETEDENETYIYDTKFGFVAGCIWGDDCSWKIQRLDLSNIHEGILLRSEDYGYVSLPGYTKLKDAVRIEDDGYVYLTIEKIFRLTENNKIVDTD